MENIKNTTSSLLKIISLNDLPNIETDFTLNSTSETETEFSQQSNNVQQLWSLPKTTVNSLEDKSLTFNISRNTVHVSTTTLQSTDEFGPPEGIEYIFVPLGVMVFVIVLSAVVFIISRKRKLERLRHRLMPMYNFDPGEEEEDDWETELLDECYNNHQRRQGYQSMDIDDNAELFGDH
ncbi:uncharacterized protein C3orf18-like isoform X1 [Vespa crabro]|uniref:uncharacterized protein C3orf18-like isoform X1 n=1 Tax=Vespa crabro TaxID=7445 RepID=UPI001F002BAC|nr:uncharacterized protein C3orf18-like isoform X1 [Vespa crabro]XP_046837938.1 uncharacterized protein C3orf18-like isoform X1 [Vespa crabro]XP_046837940.1 uncharacterized protein C3orf18-like isoform X1 [Vespa crabro]XP_046837941.1 uncharacterized protein C3orf18-like isoform X1 [Vespa crabro]